MANCFGGFASIKVLVNMLVNCLVKHGRPDLVKNYMFYGVVQHDTDFLLSAKGACAEDLLSSSFQHVQDCCQRVCELGPDFIGYHLLQGGGEQFIIVFWSGSGLFLFLFNSLTVENHVITPAGVSDCFPSTKRL